MNRCAHLKKLTTDGIVRCFVRSYNTCIGVLFLLQLLLTYFTAATNTTSLTRLFEFHAHKKKSHVTEKNTKPAVLETLVGKFENLIALPPTVTKRQH